MHLSGSSEMTLGIKLNWTHKHSFLNNDLEFFTILFTDRTNLCSDTDNNSTYGKEVVEQ